MLTFKKNGSTTLIIIIITSIIILYYINSWHSIWLKNDILIRKFNYDKQFRIAESLFNYGLLMCINNYDIFVAKKQENKQIINLYNGFWPEYQNKYFGELKILLNDSDGITISSAINTSYSQTIITASLIRNEFKDSKNKQVLFNSFKISNWKINGQ